MLQQTDNEYLILLSTTNTTQTFIFSGHIRPAMNGPAQCRNKRAENANLSGLFLSLQTSSTAAGWPFVVCSNCVSKRKIIISFSLEEIGWWRLEYDKNQSNVLLLRGRLRTQWKTELHTCYTMLRWKRETR